MKLEKTRHIFDNRQQQRGARFGYVSPHGSPLDIFYTNPHKKYTKANGRKCVSGCVCVRMCCVCVHVAGLRRIERKELKQLLNLSQK